jgi:tetratricopeptide (TPR) repeat protein
VGDAVAAQEQMSAIKALDPECKSLVCKRVKLTDLTQEMKQKFIKTKNVDSTPMIRFLKSETEPEILFEGWCTVQNMELYQVNDAHKGQRVDEERFHRAAARDAGREAWKSCPAGKVAEWGARFAAFLYEDAAALSDEEKNLAVDIATRAAEAAPKSPDHLEVLACCLFAAGKKNEAVQTLKRGLEIDPTRKSLQKRLAEFER